MRWKRDQSPHLHSLTCCGESTILSSGPWFRNSGPESSSGKGTEQEVRGEFPTVAGSSLYCTVRNTRENESAVCHYISHLIHKWLKTVVTYYSVQLWGLIVAGLLGPLTGLPTAESPLLALGVQTGLTSTVGWAGMAGGAGLAWFLCSCGLLSQAADSSVFREGVSDGVTSVLTSPKGLEGSGEHTKGREAGKRVEIDI